MSYNRAEVARTVDVLDSAVSRDGAWIEMQQYGGGPDEGQIIGNRQGYLRLGIEFLKAAVADEVEEAEAEHAQPIAVDLDYLVDPVSTINFDWFEIRDHRDAQPSYQRTWIDRIMPLGCLIAFAACVALTVIGCIEVAGWLMN